jgi:hypothetical protein
MARYRSIIDANPSAFVDHLGRVPQISLAAGAAGAARGSRCSVPNRRR